MAAVRTTMLSPEQQMGAAYCSQQFCEVCLEIFRFGHFKVIADNEDHVEIAMGKGEVDRERLEQLSALGFACIDTISDLHTIAANGYRESFVNIDRFKNIKAFCNERILSCALAVLKDPQMSKERVAELTKQAHMWEIIKRSLLVPHDALLISTIVELQKKYPDVGIATHRQVTTLFPASEKEKNVRAIVADMF